MLIAVLVCIMLFWSTICPQTDHNKIIKNHVFFLIINAELFILANIANLGIAAYLWTSSLAKGADEKTNQTLGGNEKKE